MSNICNTAQKEVGKMHVAIFPPMRPAGAFFRVMAIAVLSFAGAADHAFGGWNFGQDFSLASNLNGAWSYGYINRNDPSAFTLMPNSGVFSPGESFWYLAGTGLPSIGVNKSSTPITGAIPLNPNEGMLHPGDTAALADLSADVRWTAPANGSYLIDSLFTGNDPRGISVSTEVLLDSGTLFTAPINSFGQTASFSKVLNLNAGDTIDFVVATLGTAGDKDWTKLDANIQSASSVPEPCSLLLFGSGLGVLCCIRGRTGLRRRTWTPVKSTAVERPSK